MGPGVGYFEVVLSGTFGAEGAGQIENNFSFFCVKYIISRTVDKVTADSVAVERPF